MLRTITGLAPLSATNASNRSIRGRLKSPSGAVTMKTTSTFAANSCGRSSPEALRISALVRGSTILDGGVAVACRQAQRDEVADPGKVGALHCGIAQAPGQLRRQLGRVGGDLKVAAVLADDTAWDESFGGVRGEFRPPLAAPAEDLQFHQVASHVRLKTARPLTKTSLALNAVRVLRAIR